MLYCLLRFFQDCAIEIKDIHISSLSEAFLSQSILHHLARGQQLQFNTEAPELPQGCSVTEMNVFIAVEIYTAGEIQMAALDKDVLDVAVAEQSSAAVCSGHQPSSEEYCMHETCSAHKENLRLVQHAPV